jgi:hypothetical protein
MKISFDFDGTLARRKVMAIALSFVKYGHGVYIVSARSGEDKNVHKIYETAEQLGISTENLIFTDGEPKHHYLEGFDIHFDNNPEEIDLISSNLPTCACFLVNNYASK